MKKVAIVIIGDEILLGRVTDTNSGAISRVIDPTGCKVIKILTVGDNKKSIETAVNEALTTADIVFTTGGLGPTKDDITKKVLCETFNSEFVRDETVVENIKNIFSAKGLELNKLTFDQALVPANCHIIQNIYGTAPIMVFHREDKTLVSMPGVPNETEGMLPAVVNYLKNYYGLNHGFNHATRVLTGISESALAENLDAYENSLPEGFSLAYLPASPILKLRLDAPDSTDVFDDYVAELDSTLNNIKEVTLLAGEDISLAEIVIKNLKAKGLTISTAESCTGGNIAHLLTTVSGASDVFYGSVVSYANEVKSNVLDVGKETLLRHGAVSSPVVLQMVEGVAR